MKKMTSIAAIAPQTSSSADSIYAPNYVANAKGLIDKDRLSLAREMLLNETQYPALLEYSAIYAVEMISAGAAAEPATVFQAVFGSEHALNGALLSYLIRCSDRHYWAFSSTVDWSAIYVEDDLLDDLIVSIWRYDRNAAATAFLAVIASEPSRSRRMPPISLVKLDSASVWQGASRACAHSGRLLIGILQKIIERIDGFMNLHRRFDASEIQDIEMKATTVASFFPDIGAWQLSCLARRVDPAKAIKLYFSVFREIGVDELVSDLIFKAVIEEVNSRFHIRKTEWKGFRSLSPSDIQNLILLCASARLKVETVLLAECLRIIDPSSAVFAAWACLNIDAPEWCDMGFRRLGYVNRHAISMFPTLAGWPSQRPQNESIQHFRDQASTWPRISIVVPSFQQGHFIEDTLLSIINQGYPNIEIIVEDGGSTDETSQVLDKYRREIAHLRSSKDGGQSDAIMRGFEKASGTILSWLNSDDMLAPFALFNIAKVMMTGADIVAGACFEYKGSEFIQANLPGTPSGRLRAENLADLKNKWFMGHFFYQPEVYFTADAYKRAGGRIDKNLNYTMDYDLWLRFAALEPEFRKVFWPVALFRRHEDQKTFNLDRTVIEQGNVRHAAGVLVSQSRASHSSEVTRHKTRALFAGERINVHVVTGKMGIFFPESTQHDLEIAFADDRFKVSFSDATAAKIAPNCDLIIHVNTLTVSEQTFIEEITARGSRPLVLGWFWDNHHAYDLNMRFAQKYDLGIAGHDFAKHYLANEAMWLLPSVPLCFTHWPGLVLSEGRTIRAANDRSDALQGSFVDYADVPSRSIAIKKLIQSGMFGELSLIDHNTPGGYFSLSTDDKLKLWCRYKVSLAANVDRDIPIRFFDALVMGQIPIIPKQTLDLDFFRTLFPEDKFVVAESLAPTHVETALQDALSIFDSQSPEELRARIDVAAARHSFIARLRDLLVTCENAAFARGVVQ